MATHRAHTQDWGFSWDYYNTGGSGLVYHGAESGWYPAPKWSESDYFGEEDEDVETLRGVYLIQAVDSGRVKIGYSSDVYRRLNSLRTGSPERLELIGVIDHPQEEEKHIHKRFSAYRIHGEWFEGAVLEELHDYPRV